MRPIIKYWLAVLLWMVLIFSASSDRGSFQHSSRLIGPLVQWLFPHITPAALNTTVMFARKCAHVTEYAILAILVWRALRSLALREPDRWHWPDASRTLLLVVLYAATDEFHQRYVPSREASVRDVLLDTSGAILALLVLWGIAVWRTRRQKQSLLANSENP